MKKIITNPYFFVPAIIIAIVLFILFLKWNKYRDCLKQCNVAPVRCKCNFWTGNRSVEGNGGNTPLISGTCQSANPGFDNNGYYTRACGGIPGGGGGNCDPDNPGKDMNGFLSSNCGG